MVPFRIPEPLTSGDNEENCWLSSQSEAIIGTADFIGINYYSLCPKISVSTLEQGWREYYSIYASNCPLDKSVRDYTADMSISYKTSKTDPPAGKVKEYQCVCQIQLQDWVQLFFDETSKSWNSELTRDTRN